ncbi:MAG: SDR family oxidoreductase [Candidatus Marinimicrobia bacterium]|nr:SDR family oxidoreductase [Candidatus Neomarinimicrobiota bacterium]
MSNNGKILVTGANGNVSSALITNLVDKGASVRGLVRDESKGQSLKDSGVEIAIGNLNDQDSIEKALEGVEKVFLLTPVAEDAPQLAKNVIDAAVKQGSPYIVRVSAVGAASDAPSRNSRAHAETEADLKNSGLPYTILKPHFFMQNMMMAAESIASEGKIYMPFKDGKLGMIDIRDVADVSAVILTEEGHEGKTYTPSGPKSISMTEVAAAFSSALDKEVNYIDVPMEAADESLSGMGFPEWNKNAYLEYFKAYSEGWGDYTSSDVEDITGNPARSIETFAKDFAQVFGG